MAENEELKAEVEELKAEVEELKAEVEELKARKNTSHRCWLQKIFKPFPPPVPHHAKAQYDMLE